MLPPPTHNGKRLHLHTKGLELLARPSQGTNSFHFTDTETFFLVLPLRSDQLIALDVPWPAVRPMGGRAKGQWIYYFNVINRESVSDSEHLLGAPWTKVN